MSTTFRRLAIAACAGGLILAGSTAGFAQSPSQKKARAAQLFKQGNTQYNLGRWEEAIEYFQQSYEEYPSDNLLFNIAQAYRQWGKCRKALFFYKRFLAVKPNTPNKDEVQGFINDLDETCKKNQESSERPPLEAIRPEGIDGKDGGTGTGHTSGGTAGGTGDGKTRVATKDDDNKDDNWEDPGIERTPSVSSGPYRPTKVASSVSIGTALIGMGDFDVPAQLSLAVGAGYPMAVGPVDLELGGLITYTPVPWDNQAVSPPKSGTAGLTSLLANVGALYPVIDKLSARAELGLGVLFFSGVDSPGNVFIQQGKMANGALSMFHLRVALGAEYAITDNIVVNAHPVVFSWSPARSGLREDISSITRFELLVGVGYKL